jgi:hypothetical protein
MLVLLFASEKVRREDNMVMKISSSTQLQTMPVRERGLFPLIVFSLFLISSCVAYAPVPAPAAYYRVSSYRIAWENAQRAAEDVGIRITSADEGSGTIEGQADRTAVTISVRRLPDERIRLEVSLRGPSRDAYIADEFHRAYERRVGRY